MQKFHCECTLNPSPCGLQIVTDALVKRPKPGDLSHALYQEELVEVLKALENKATLVYTKMNKIPGVYCNEVQGAMYAYPRIDIPEEAEEDAKVCMFVCLFV